MALTYTLIKAFVIYAINLFFREVVIINEDSIPQQGATIVYGNHNNQFVDAMVSFFLIKLLIKSIPRIVHFLAAAKSMKRWVLGTLIKMSCAIPVERAVDLAK
jgi:glycerol-3-phosphate O-acyltransferase/dihydroxyacetone phosphate acyltransferase